MNHDMLIHARQAAFAAAQAEANAILSAPIYAEHALKIYLQGKAQVFEAALQAVRASTKTYKAPLHPQMIRVAEQAARSIHWLE